MRTALVTGILFVTLLAACSRSSPPAVDPQLRKAETVARYLTSARHLGKSAYPATRRTGTPSELVSYVFSDIGAAEWPPGEDASPMEQEQARATRMPLLPRDVGLVANRPDPRLRKQVVLRGDDAKNELVAEGYADPSKPPVFVERWAMVERKK